MGAGHALTPVDFIVEIVFDVYCRLLLQSPHSTAHLSWEGRSLQSHCNNTHEAVGPYRGQVNIPGSVASFLLSQRQSLPLS